jgi:hypothetical protein
MSTLFKSIAIIIAVSACLSAARAEDVSSQMSNPKERAALKKVLITEKKVKTWPRPGMGLPESSIPLSVTECVTLGGKLVVDLTCTYQITCQGSNNGQACITQITTQR